MTPNPAMDFPLFPPIEIEIPDLANYYSIQEELRLYKLSDAAWKANLEAALKSHGIFLQPSSPASTIALSVAEHAFASLVPQIVSVQSLSPAQWASRREKGAVSVPVSSPGEGEDIPERDRVRDHDNDSNHSEGQIRDNEPVRDRPAARSSIASSAARRLAPGVASSSEDLILSDMPSSFGVSDSEHDIDISEIFQYPPPEPEPEPENPNSENEDESELILPDTPRTSVETEGSKPLTTAGPAPISEAAALKAKIMAGNYPDVSIRAISGFPSSTTGEAEDIELIGDETQNVIDVVGVRENTNHITILPSEPLTLKDSRRNIGQILSSPSLLSRSQNNSSDVDSGLVRRNPTTAHLIQSALSSPPESTHDIWNNMLDGMLHRPHGHGNGSSSPSSMFFPIHKVSPSSIPQTPSSARSNNNSIMGTPMGRTVTPEAGASASTTTSPHNLHNVSSSSGSSRRRLIFRNSLKSVQSRLRNSVSKKGFTYANNITAAVTAAAVARSRNRQQDIEDTTPGYQKDQLEAQNHIETISQRCRNGSHRKIYRCTLCNYSGPRDKTVLMHIRMVHIGTDRRHPCPHCQFRFKNSSHLRKHIQRKHSEASTNGYGSRLTKNEVDLLDLSKFEEGEENPSDDGEDPLRDDGLNMNYGNNDGNDENPDQSAHEDFQIREAWELIHDNDMKPRYLCLFCDSVYNDEDTVVGHILSSHKCRNCSETFQLQETLQEHQEFSCLAALNNDSGNFNPSALSVSRSRGQGSSGTKNPNARKRSRPDTDKLNTLGKKRKKRNNTLQYSFTESMKHFLDPKILHVKNPKPPYICTLCHLTLNSTRQSARLHVRNVHFKNAKWLFQNQC